MTAAGAGPLTAVGLCAVSIGLYVQPMVFQNKTPFLTNLKKLQEMQMWNFQVVLLVSSH